MIPIVIDMPDDIADRLKNVARSRGVSMNKLVTELSVQSLAAYDAEIRFKAAAASANIPEALAVLDRLDRY